MRCVYLHVELEESHGPLRPALNLLPSLGGYESDQVRNRLIAYLDSCRSTLNLSEQGMRYIKIETNSRDVPSVSSVVEFFISSSESFIC